jgi:hypothetical protein
MRLTVALLLIDCNFLKKIRISFLRLRQIPHNFPQFPPAFILKQDYHIQIIKVN